MNIDQSILGIGSLSIKEINQDSVAAKNISGLCNIVVVADGLGSFYKSEVASRFVCENLIELVTKHNTEDDILLEELFQKVTSNLNKEVSQESTEDIPTKSFGTTLLCCIETNDEFIIGYVGNGGIFHIRGNFNAFPERFYLPWNSVNLLNPHSIEQEGKNAMYKLIEPSPKLGQSVPSIIKIRKDQLYFGDIIMICSDGVYSYDEVQIGRDPNGKIWISGEESMERLYKHLDLYFLQNTLTNEALNKSLSQYLEELKTENLIDDDTSLALIISEKAKNFQKGKLTTEQHGADNKN